MVGAAVILHLLFGLLEFAAEVGCEGSSKPKKQEPAERVGYHALTLFNEGFKLGDGTPVEQSRLTFRVLFFNVSDNIGRL
jgi:hypothetical protein